MGITAGNLLYEFVAPHYLYVGKSLKMYLWQTGGLVMLYHPSYGGGIVEYAAALALSQHLVEVALKDMETEAADGASIESWRLLFAHRRQLRLVADEHQVAVVARVDISDEVVEQLAAAKRALAE